jgi:2'-5' RNA ligase
VRLFVAVDLDDDVRRDVGRVIQRLRSETRDDRVLRISWVAPERLHLTLHFLGEVNDPTAARVVESMAPPIDLRAFNLAFGEVGTFSSRGRPNVIWLGITEGRAPLIELHDLVGRRLKAVGCALEDRPFSPHLTLARLRQTVGTGPPPRRMRELSPIPGRRGAAETGRMRVDRVTLYESRLGRDGATHIALASSPLGSPRRSS